MSNSFVIGCGAWSTALATVMAENCKKVTLSGLPSDPINLINSAHTHPKLPGIKLSHKIHASNTHENIQEATVVLFAPPAQFVRATAQTLQNKIAPHQSIICAAKGIENKTNALMSEILQEYFPNNTIAILSGPNFAIEVARKKPSATTIACAEMDQWKTFESIFETPSFHLSFTHDTTGAQLGGALKNVIAIGCGILKGLGYEDNTQAAFITNAFHEVVSIGQSMGARHETFLGLSGMGDLMLTCMGAKSRNLAFGEKLAQAPNAAALIAENTDTVEGIPTTKSVHEYAKKQKVELPYLNTLYHILFQNKPVHTLLDQMVKVEESLL